MSSWCLISFISIFLVAILFNIKSEISSYDIRNNNYKKLSINIFYKRIYIIIGILSFVLLCATRSKESYDTITYIEYLKQIDKMPFFELEGTYGIGFEIFTKILTLFIGSKYQLYFGAIALLNCLIVYGAIKKIKTNCIDEFALYICFLGIYYNFIVLRQGIAISFIILAYVEFINSKRKWILYVFLATLFHESAIVVILLLFFIIKVNIKKIVLYVIWLISLFLYLTKISNNIIVPILSFIYKCLPFQAFYKYFLYFDNVEFSDDISFLYLIYFIISLLIISITKYKNVSLVYKKLECLNIIGLLFLGFFSGIPAIIRAVDYFLTCTYIFLVFYILKKFDMKIRRFILLGIFLIVVIFYLRIILKLVEIY